MKRSFLVLQIIIGLLAFPSEIFSQLDMQNYIGKSRSELIDFLGKPVYTDDSNKSMVMMFYKSLVSSKSFVADEGGIFQAEATQQYETQKSQQAALNGYIADMISKGYTVDTLAIGEFQSDKPGVTCTVHCGLNSTTNKYEITVSAHKKEG